MLKQLNEINPWLLALAAVGVAELFSIGVMLLCRKRYGMDRLALNNEVAGFKFAVIGVFYAVLLAFVVVAVWEDYRDTEAAVRNEAKALIDLNQMSYALPGQTGDPVRQRTISYLKQVRDSEWPAMSEGRSSTSAAAELRLLRRSVLEASPAEIKDAAIFHHALDLLTTINDNRNERLDKSDGTVPMVLWLVLAAGAFNTLGYPSFFGSSNLGAQILMTAALAALVALTLYVAVLLDFPFTGGVGISHAPFDQALGQMPSLDDATP
jgi:hypothetical protein